MRCSSARLQIRADEHKNYATVIAVKAMILYRSNSEHERQALDYVRDFARHTGKTLETLDVNTRAGAEKAALYDIMKFPCILAVDDQGQMLQLWQGDMLPRFDEVSFYAEV